ncbi:MAG: glycoside hydrolase family 88 protein [Lutimonas sp.]|jgi:unsaturated chondroitin disaccharide hydrolase
MSVFKLVSFFFIAVALNGCEKKESDKKVNINEILQKAENQLARQLEAAEKEGRIPRTVSEDGAMHWTNQNFDWTEGFFPGSCWYLYEYSQDETWSNAAEKFQGFFEDHKYRTNNHDLGFIFNCSYGNAYRITNDEAYKNVMITAADSLITRFNPAIGCIKSWDVDSGWQAERNWQFPVIIDNMMNLELLFKVSEFTGDNKYKDIAISHANTTLQHHFRDNNSSFHVVDYDPITGEVRSKQTAQGYADASSWARGQAWGLYGYTVCYRFTKDERYLKQAEKIAAYILENDSTPDDGIPYWDYDAPVNSDTPRDVSAACITASALIELDTYTDTSYQSSVDRIITSLASEHYTSARGENQDFVLLHSVGSIPHNNEIDVPLNYADYYYLEALLRYKNMFLKEIQ